MKIAKIGKDRKFLIALIAVFILVGFFFVLFHHHADGQDHQAHCLVCRLVQQVVGFFILAVTVLIGLSQNSKRFFVVSSHNFVSLLVSSKLQNRAPPVLA